MAKHKKADEEDKDKPEDETELDEEQALTLYKALQADCEKGTGGKEFATAAGAKAEGFNPWSLAPFVLAFLKMWLEKKGITVPGLDEK